MAKALPRDRLSLQPNFPWHKHTALNERQHSCKREGLRVQVSSRVTEQTNRGCKVWPGADGRDGESLPAHKQQKHALVLLVTTDLYRAARGQHVPINARTYQKPQIDVILGFTTANKRVAHFLDWSTKSSKLHRLLTHADHYCNLEWQNMHFYITDALPGARLLLLHFKISPVLFLTLACCVGDYWITILTNLQKKKNVPVFF